MLNTFLFTVLTGVSMIAVAEPMTFTGRDYSGKPCMLTVHNPEEVTGAWKDLVVVVSTPWQVGDDMIQAKASATPYSYYGRSKKAPDRIAVEFGFGKVASLDLLQSFIFQTYSKKTGLFQSKCRDLMKEQKQ